MSTSDAIVCSTRVRVMPLDECPRERLKSVGPSGLSNAELIDILLRTGVKREGVLSMAQRLISHFEGLRSIAAANFAELSNIHGLSDAKVSQLMSALELGRRLASMHPEDRVSVRSPEDIANLLMPEMSFLDQEHQRVDLLKTKNPVTAIREVYIGNVNSSVVRPAEIFRPAVRETCPSVILVTTTGQEVPLPARRTC